jgi:hypothetical protein
MGDFYKLIGYELIGYHKQEHWNYPFLYNIYYLRTYDDGCPDVQRCCYIDGGMPCEGVTVKELLESAKAQAIIRHCFDCKKLHNPDNACHLYQVKHNFTESPACERFTSASNSDKETRGKEQ